MMDDERYYFQCPMRKNQSRVAVTVCHGKKCLFLASEGGKLRCGYGDKVLPGKRPPVSRVDRDGLS
jgi:hypothetical protein